MSSKTKILDRLRLYAKADREYLPSHWEDNSLFVDFPENSNTYIDIFTKNLEKLNGEFFVVKNFAAASQQILKLVKDTKPELCGSHSHPLINQLQTTEQDLALYMKDITTNEVSSEDFASFEIGITAADYMIARTGSILLRTRSAGGRRLSILPPVHIVIGTADQIVPSIDQALLRIKKVDDDWSYATIISGPSRTSDIEKQLVLGAHGPKRLIVILIESKDQI